MISLVARMTSNGLTAQHLRASFSNHGIWMAENDRRLQSHDNQSQIKLGPKNSIGFTSPILFLKPFFTMLFNNTRAAAVNGSLTHLSIYTI